MTNTPDLLEKIRTKIAEAVPEILSDCVICGDSREEPECIGIGGHVVEARPIRLADVLLAIDARSGLVVHATGLMQSNTAHSAHWNLTKDLDEQNEETLNFISYILGVV